MAQKGVHLDQETFSCSICLDLLKDPVTTPCGHSYCMNCIEAHWDEEEEKRLHSCPQCRQTFRPRPFLMKNTMLAVLVEELKRTELQDSTCPRHGEVMNMFCLTDQQCICSLCYVRQHKGHDTVSAAAERAERQRELEVGRRDIWQRIQDREEDVTLLQLAVETIDCFAHKAVGDIEKIFTQLIRLMKKRRSDVRQQVRTQQGVEASRVKELQEELQQEITELKRRDAELKKLSPTEDHSQFLTLYSSLSPLSESTHPSSIHVRPVTYFEDVTVAVSELRDKLQDVLRDKWTKISLLPQPEPKTRADFLKHLCQITLDPNTASEHLLLSEGNRRAALMRRKQRYSDHRDRFTEWCQVLSRDSLPGRCYWEVEWTGAEVCVAVAYKNISRGGGSLECGFGLNDKSWSLYCDANSYEFYHNNICSPVQGPWSSRVGVYLDHSAGLLSFYSVSETMTLLHRVRTTFTQPLYAGLWFFKTFKLFGFTAGESAEFCDLRWTQDGIWKY